MIFETIWLFFLWFWHILRALLAPLGTIWAVLQAICALNGSIGRRALFHKAFWAHFFIRGWSSRAPWRVRFCPQIGKSCNWKHKCSKQNSIASKIQCKAHTLTIFKWFWMVFSFENIVNNVSVAQSENFRFWGNNPASRPPKESFLAPLDAIWHQNCTTKQFRGGLGSFNFLMYETLANNIGGGTLPPSPWDGKTEFRAPAPDQENIALAPAREHGKSIDDVTGWRQTSARDRLLRSKATFSTFWTQMAISL